MGYYVLNKFPDRSMEVRAPAPLGNYDRQTDQPTDRMTDRPDQREVSLPISAISGLYLNIAVLY